MLLGLNCVRGQESKSECGPVWFAQKNRVDIPQDPSQQDLRVKSVTSSAAKPRGLFCQTGLTGPGWQQGGSVLQLKVCCRFICFFSL